VSLFRNSGAIGKELLQKELKHQLEGVDEYPSFVDCDKLVINQRDKNVF
jgi:hypothetical protein